MINWYVLSTKPKKEFQVERLFIEGGFTVYNPKFKLDDKVYSFFPGYQFVAFEYPEQYRMVKYTRGVKRIIGIQEKPVPIDENIIDELKKREINGFIELEKHGKIPEIGDEIEVVEGPLKGLKGIFKEELKATDRVLILLNYITYQGRAIVDKKKLKKLL